HRDFQRALERALRRAEVPMAYSAGFSPHPRISYAGAAPTGAASEAEYVEIGLARRCRPDDVRVALDAALPAGLDVLVRHSTPAVRPDDVLAALRVVAHLAPPSPPVATRLAQGPLDEADGAVADPLAAD